MNVNKLRCQIVQFIQKHTNDKFYLEGSHKINVKNL